MRYAALSLVILAAGCAARVDEGPGEELPELSIRVQADLPKVFLVGLQPNASAALVNSSATHTYRVVKAGDGSEVGWREPYAYWTAEIDRDGVWSPLSANRGRCGNMNSYGDEAVMQLRPGEEMPLWDYAAETFEFLEPGKVRLVAHYEYRGGRFDKGGLRAVPFVLPSMQGVAPFAVASPPVEFEVVRPYELRVTVKKPLKVDAVNRLTDHFEVQLFNRTRKVIACKSQEAKVTLHTRPWMHESSLKIPRDAATKELTCALQPGEGVSLVKAGLLAGGDEGTWAPGLQRVIRMQAECHMTIDGELVPLKSEWADVSIEK